MKLRPALPALLDAPPRVASPLDPGFRPLSLGLLRYREALAAAGGGEPLRVGVERENGLVSVFETRLLPPGCDDAATRIWAERLVKFLLWSRGGWKIVWQGPKALGESLRVLYSAEGGRAFDARVMSRIYRKPFAFVLAGERESPSEKEASSVLGGHWDGCRVGFDLGASDFKVAAVVDGNPVYSEEIPWQPGTQPDPAFHYGRIQDGLKAAAARLPRVDAIGGSAAGVYIDNQVRIASLFRGVAEDVFEERVRPMFLEMRREWGVPLEVINDGEVTALVGTLTLGRTPMLGVAMGSSQAAGYVNGAGRIPGWLDELAFVPVDANPAAPPDEWSGDVGVGALYFSQQAVNKLAPAAGFAFAADVPLPERLKEIQRRAEDGHPGARAVFETIGIYLGYAIPYYALFYDFGDLLVLGRVLSGAGGEAIVAKAGEVLRTEFPDLAERVAVHLLEEKSRRVGQAVAAASLPRIPTRGEGRAR
ncbi:MAG: ROK family protein [Candidatus Aminicenantes bacterium]|nr:ROK family protein [Candidatus Aminicenantes bacterium]